MRKIEIIEDTDRYEFSIDGKGIDLGWNKSTPKELESYHGTEYATELRAELVKVLEWSLQNDTDLTPDEINEAMTLAKSRLDA